MSQAVIEKDSMVKFHYHLKNGQGETIDRSTDEPLSYVHGRGTIIPGLEAAMAGRHNLEQFSIHVPPSLGYGLFDEDKVFAMEPGDLPSEIEVNSVLELTPEEGVTFQARVISIEEHQVELDGNHPLAGQDLHFEIQIVEVRPASSAEITQIEQAQKA